MFQAASLLALTSLAVVYGQQVGTLTTETHPPMTWAQCTSSGCTTQNSAVVLDSNWRWLHSTTGSTNCYTGNTWDATLCPDATTCAANCALDGGDYSGTYGITTSGNALTLKLITTASQKNVGSRVYLMAPGSTSAYQMFKPNNQEFTFDVDVSQLPCGLNGALYFVQMDSDGGMARFPTNKAGAKYGTGYCDSQCPRDIKFINGQANSVGWTPSTNDTNAGLGNFGSCCAEMDIWEANSISSAFTPHPCTVTQQTRCTAGTDCSAAGSTGGVCDQAGCDFNAFRMGVTNFYGPGMTLDTNTKMTVTTAFHTADNTATGALTSISRTWSQGGKVIANVNSTVAGVTGNALSDSFCSAQKTAFGDTNTFSQKGGMTGMGTAQAAGVVLVMSIWDDHTANMLWLDSDYPLNKAATSPGVARGTCATTSGNPTTIENGSTNPQVTFSNIKFGPIGSTGTGTVTSPGGGGGTTSTGSTSTASAPSATQTKYGQCGGIGYSGPTACASGSTCKSSSPYYSQCL